MLVRAKAITRAFGRATHFVLSNLEIIVSLLIPFFVGSLVFLISLSLGELASKLFTKSGDIFVSLDVVPSDALVEFSVANWAEVARMSISLLKMIGSFL